MMEVLHVGTFSTCMRQPDKHGLFALAMLFLLAGIATLARTTFLSNSFEDFGYGLIYTVCGLGCLVLGVGALGCWVGGV